MMNRLISILAMLIAIALVFGCSENATQNSPISPPVPDNNTELTTPSGNHSGCDCGHNLWGFWQGVIDPETGDMEFASLREALFHVNVTGYLQAPMPPGLGIVINEFNKTEGTIDLDLTITHPFPGSNLRGFDVRGIVMGAGDTLQSDLDTGIIYAAPSGFRLENADGYSRWWNAGEFTTKGLYGYTPGDLGFKIFTPATTLNPYKYFADPLSANDPVVPDVSLANRGTFSTTPDPAELTRNYQLRFPIGPGGNPNWLFQYAIDASWAPPTGSSTKPKPITDFPMEANSPEAFHIKIDTTGTTAYYENETSFGGNLVLSIEVFDWQAPSNPDGINGEVASIWVESETLFDSIESVELTPTAGSQPTSGVYQISIPNVHPTGIDDQEVLITVRSSDPTTYEPPVAGPDYPTGAALAAYAIVEIQISNIGPQEAMITVTSPNGGEELEATGSWDITWSSLGPVGDNVSIGYTVSDGAINYIVGSTENDGSHKWDPVADIESEEVKVVVISIDDPLVKDESDDYFTITSTPEPQIIVTVPNGGEVWEPGGAETITWNSVGDVGFNVSIDYTIDNGPLNNITGYTDNDGEFLWVPIPDIESDQVKIVVTSVSDPAIFDESDQFFTITSEPDPQLILTVPNGGEMWEAGSTEEITWTSIGPVGFEVRLDYSIDSGPPINIVSTTNNDESYMWDPIPDIDSSSVKVIVSSFLDPGVTDDSDDYFTIYQTVEPKLTVSVPNGGEVWQSGTSEEITWTSEGDVGEHVKIEYQVEWGIPELIIDSTENDGLYTWDPIPDEDSDHVLVIITSIENPLITDDSDDFFTITPTPVPSITVTTPNGSEDWTIGTSEFIEWTSENLTGQVMIEYTLFDGDTPITITAATDDTGSFEWTPIPGPETDEARVSVTSIDFPTASDSSDDFFTISEPKSLTLTSPNGGENLTAGETWEITWDSTGIMGNVKLSASEDSGGSFTIQITDSTGNDGSYLWDPVYSINSSTMQVRVEWTEDAGIYDDSDADFTITIVTVTGWNPDPDITQFELLSQPNQDTEPVDIAVFSLGADNSVGEVVDELTDSTFMANDDAYLNVQTLWQYETFASPIHKFDVSLDGSWIFISNSNSESFPHETVNDPMYCAYSCNNNVTGELSDGYWHIYCDKGDPDPDAIAWRRMVDFSCGVPGGIDETTSYHLVVHAMHPDQPQPHDGNILVGAWDAPYDGTSTTFYFLDSSTQGGGQGLVDDTAPELMALAVDDNTDLVFGSEPAVAMWVLDSVGAVQCHMLAFTSGDVAFIDNQLDSEEYGTATPVDIEIANAMDFGYEVTDPGFNWLCALLDNGDGTWSVGIWECDYLAGPPAEFTMIDITDPIAGMPMALDIDPTDFEIHVLADNAGTIEVTVFEYTP